MMLPIYVIALKKSKERRQIMTKRLERLGLEFSFTDAVVGKDIHDSEKNRLCSQKRQRFLRFPLSNGALGCLMSHRAIWQKMQEDRIDNALILEDDAVIAPEILDVLPRLEKLKGHFDVISLHDMKGLPLIDIAEISGSHRLSTTRYNNIGAVSYVISKKAAKHLLDLSLPAIFEVDVLMNRWWDHGLQTLLVTPQVVNEDDSPSTIGYGKAQPVWPDDTIIHKLNRRFNRAKDSIAKRRLFVKMMATAKMRLKAASPDDTSFNS